MRFILAAPTILASALLTSCNFPGVMCDTGVNIAVRVLVVDATTGTPLTGASGHLINERVRTDLTAGNDNQLYAYAGTDIYELVIERAGYQTWRQPNVVVHKSDGDCPDYITQELSAALEPES